MRISDWSSDVCSSDLVRRDVTAPFRFPRFFVTNPSPCPYLPGRSERKVFTELSGENASELNDRSEEHTSELQSLMRISYAVFCLKKKKKTTQETITHKH